MNQMSIPHETSAAHEQQAANKSSTKPLAPPPHLQVSSSDGILSFKFSYLLSGGLLITDASGRSTSTGEAVYEGETIPNFRPNQFPQFFILEIQNVSARLILTKDVKDKAEVVFDKVHEGAQVPQLDGVYVGQWKQVFIPNI